MTILKTPWGRLDLLQKTFEFDSKTQNPYAIDGCFIEHTIRVLMKVNGDNKMVVASIFDPEENGNPLWLDEDTLGKVHLEARFRLDAAVKHLQVLAASEFIEDHKGTLKKLAAEED